ncbi:MAG: hypothetical protein AAFX05_10455, partial [Planctomycetota bacterium]
MTTMTQPREGVENDVLNSAASPEGLAARAAQATHAALDALYAKLHDDGHWCAELEGDSILNSEYLLMKAILG